MRARRNVAFVQRNLQGRTPQGSSRDATGSFVKIATRYSRCLNIGLLLKNGEGRKEVIDGPILPFAQAHSQTADFLPSPKSQKS